MSGYNFDKQSAQRIVNATRTVENRSGARNRQQLWFNRGGGSSTTNPTSTTWFWALIDGYRWLDEGVSNLYSYQWKEADVDCAGVATVKVDGLNSDSAGVNAVMTETDVQPTEFPFAPVFTAPVTSTLPDTSSGTPPTMSVSFDWTPVDTLNADRLMVGTTAAGSSDLHNTLHLTSPQTVASLPVDGSTIYVRIGPSSGYFYRDYELTLTLLPDAFAITEDEINADALGELSKPIGGGADPVGTAIVTIDTPRLVRMENKPCEASSRYMFHLGFGTDLNIGTSIYQRYVYDVGWDTATCVITVTYHWHEFIEAYNDGTPYYLYVKDWSTDPNA